MTARPSEAQGLDPQQLALLNISERAAIYAEHALLPEERELLEHEVRILRREAGR